MQQVFQKKKKKIKRTYWTVLCHNLKIPQSPFSQISILLTAMFFKNCVLLSDFMAALSDPRAFISAQEKRNQQLKAMGIEETDIKDPLVGVDGNSTAGGGGKKGSKTGGAKGAAAGAKVEEEKKGTFLFMSESPPFIIMHSHHLFTACSVHGTDTNSAIV